MVYRFGDFELREEDFCLLRQGSRVSLEPKTLRVLLQLVSHAGHLVEKNALLETVWTDTFVEENTLARAITVLRHELGDNSRDPRFIQTIPTRGYRFIAPVEALPAIPPSNAESNGSFQQPALVPDAGVEAVQGVPGCRGSLCSLFSSWSSPPRQSLSGAGTSRPSPSRILLLFRSLCFLS